MKKVFFYSSVSDISLFKTQKFYQVDIEVLNELGYEVHTTNKITDFFKFKQYDTAFIYFYRFGLFVAIIAKLLGKKVYFTGGIDYLDSSYATKKEYREQKLLFKLCLFFSTKCILVSTSDQENVKKIYQGKLPAKTVLSFHTFDVAKFACETFNHKKNNFVSIAWMGTVQNVRRKGLDTAIYLYDELRKKFPAYKDTQFLIVGKQGVGCDYLKNIVEELDLSDRVIFPGEIEEQEKVEVLKQNRFYMQLSKYEGFGVAAAEALAAGCIVLTSGKGGLRDSVGAHGVYVDIDKDLIQQLDGIQKHIQQFDEITLEEAYQYTFDNFSYEKRKNDFSTILA